MSLVRVELTVPYTEGSVLGEIRKAGVIEEEAYDEVGTRVVAHVPFPMARRLQSRGAALTPRDAKADAKAEAEAGRTPRQKNGSPATRTGPRRRRKS